MVVAVAVAGGAVVGGAIVGGGCRKEEEIRAGDKNLCKNNRATQSLNLPGRANRN